MSKIELADNISSMTGYGAKNISIEGFDIIIEIKSVNSRGRDIRLRLPSLYDRIEPQVRKIFEKMVFRGSLTISISVQNNLQFADLEFNEKLFANLLDIYNRAEKQVKNRNIKMAKSSLIELLSADKVIERREGVVDKETQERIDKEVLTAIEQATIELIKMRRNEGQKLANIIADRLIEIENLTQQADKYIANNGKVILEKLKSQISEITEFNSQLSEDRLHQEAIFLATKSDIREEIDRLYAHIKSAKELLKQGGVIGRKFDFLSQEFNREANTICSKANLIELNAIGLNLKIAIEQMREQVQNIE